MTRSLKALIEVALCIGVGVLVWMLALVFDRIPNVLITLLFAVLFSYLIYPIAKALSRRMPRELAVALVYIVLVALLVLSIAYVAPSLAAQAQDLARHYPATVRSVQAQIADPARSPLLARFPAGVRASIAEYAGRAGDYAGIAASTVGERVLPVLSGGVKFVVDTVLVLGLSFLFISDLEKIQSIGLRLVPKAKRPQTLAFVVDVNRVVGGFVRGQVLMGLGVGVVATLVLIVLGVPYGILLGFLVGVASIVPLIGGILGSVPAVLVALFTVGFVKALIILGLFVVVFFIQGHILTPIIISRSVGVTPLVVFIALLVGEESFGILGMLLAVPISGILRVAMLRIFPEDEQTREMLVAEHDRTHDVFAPSTTAS